MNLYFALFLIMQTQHIFNIEKFVSYCCFQSETDWIDGSKSADPLPHWNFQFQTQFWSAEMCVFEKNEGQKTAFHTCTSSVKRNSKFGKCFPPKSKLNRNMLRRVGQIEGMDSLVERNGGGLNGRAAFLFFGRAQSQVTPFLVK